MRYLRSAIMACALSGLVACVSMPAARAAKPDFGGEWSVKWCDKTDPQADCGGFYVSLVQLVGWGERSDAHPPWEIEKASGCFIRLDICDRLLHVCSSSQTSSFHVSCG
ncbi:MAG: hypothetical protein ABL934_07805 [Lysobacteraceae bacterium]